MALVDYTNFEKIQRELDLQFVPFNPQAVQDNIGFLRTIGSPLNTNAGGFSVQQDITNTDPGKIHKLQVSYRQRRVDADIGDDSIQVCDGDVINPQKQFDYDLDPAVGNNDKGKVLTIDLVRSEQSPVSELSIQIQMGMDGIERKMDKSLLTTAAANFGNFESTGNALPVNVKTLKTDGETFFQAFISGVKDQFRLMKYNGNVWIFGEGKVSNWFDQQPPADQNSGDNIPIQAARRGGFGFEFDENVETIVGTDEFIAMVPGACQLVTWNQYVGAGNVLQSDEYMQGTLMNPNSQIVYDVLVKFDCGKYLWQVKLAYDLLFLPTDLFQATDDMDGVNWFNNFKVVN